MEEPQFLSRRRLLHGVAAGAAMAAPWITAASARQDQDASTTFTLVTNHTPSDLDPHAAYDVGSGAALQGPFEGLIRLAPGTTDDYQPLLAESWFASEDRSVWTF